MCKSLEKKGKGERAKGKDHNASGKGDLISCAGAEKCERSKRV